MINRIFAIVIITMLLSPVAHELCFEDTTLGGWLPYLGLTFGPAIGFLIGAFRSSAERRALRRWNLLNSN